MLDLPFEGLVRRGAAILALTLGCLAAAVLPAAATISIGVFTLTKTADRATYSAEGEVITYTYSIFYDGPAPSIDFDLVDDLIPGPFVCSNPGFGPFDGYVMDGGTTTCTGTYTVTAADMLNTQIVNEARACAPLTSFDTRGATPGAAAPCPSGYATSNTDDAVVTRAAGGQLSLEKTADEPTFAYVGEQIGYTYVVTNTGASPITDPITVSDDKIPSGAVCPETMGLMPGESITCKAVYTITAADIAAGEVVNVAVASAGAISSAPDRATVQSSGDQSTQIVQNFIENRVSMLLTDQPDRPNIIRQDPNLLYQPGGGGPPLGFAPFDVGMTGGGPGGRFDFSTSLSQIEAFVAANEALDAARDKGDPYVVMADLYIPEAPPQPLPQVQRRAFDVWAEGHFAFNRNTAGPATTAGLGILYIGADYLINPRLLAGVIAQFDWMSQTQAGPNATVRGLGWMAGPYVSARLGDHFFFDARLQGGTSTNTLTAPGIPGDVFTTGRLLARTNFSGNWSNDRWRFTPSLSVAYMLEVQRAYTSALGNPVPQQSVGVGRLSFMPEIGRRFVTSGGTVIEPQLGLGLNWDFARSGGVIPGGVGIGPPLRGVLQAGVQVRMPNGISARLAGTWDGIGTPSYRTFGAQLWISIPLN